MLKTTYHKTLRAFSLVELAIALVIIGLLIGAVLKGQELLASARLKTIITQLNQYRLATNTFVDRYGSLPGDYDKASSYIKEDLKNGNNNGMIEGLGLSAGGGNFDHEATSFWAHLAAAELIPDPGTSTNSGSTISFDAGAPATKIGGGITIAHTPLKDLNGHWFIIGSQNGTRNNAALLTPLETLSLAKKMDTEDPFSGSVQMRNGTQTSGNSLCLKANNILNTSNKNPACVMYVKL